MPEAYSQDDVFKAQHIVDGVLCPAEICAVFVVSHTVRAKDRADDVQRLALYRIDLGTRQIRRLTPESCNSSQPQFGTDPAELYFLSARDATGGETQVFRLRTDGGEAEQVTRLEGGVTAYALSPDGKTLALVSAGQKPKARGPRDHIRITRLNYRFDPLPGYLQDAPQTIYLVSTEGGEPQRAIEPDGMISALSWSPDSRQLAFIRGWSATSTQFGHGDLCVLNPGSGARVLMADGLFQLPFWNADQRLIGFCAPPDGDFTRQSQLYVLDAQETGAASPRTATLDRSIPPLFQINSPAARSYGIPRVLPDSNWVYLTVGDGGQGNIVRVALSGPQACETLVSGRRICKLLDVRGQRLLYTAQDCNTPTELFVAHLDGTAETRLTGLNLSWQAEVLWPDVRHARVKSEKNVEVELWVLVPKHVAPPHKTILYIHGGPHAAFGWGYSEDMQELAGAGYAVIFANPRGSLGYGDAFSSSIAGRWGELELVDFDAVLDYAIEQGIADPKRIGVTGVSGGGHLSGWLITQRSRFAAAVPEQGLYNMFSTYGVADCGVTLAAKEMGGLPHERPETYWKLSAVAHAHQCRTPTLLIQGEDDVRCPMQQAEEFFVALKVAGCEVELLRLKCNHGTQMVGPPHLRRFRMDAIKDWFARHLA